MVPLFMPFQFQEAEKKRYRAEQQRFETKHRRQLEESRATANSAVKELEQLQVRVGPRSQIWQFMEQTGRFGLLTKHFGIKLMMSHAHFVKSLSISMHRNMINTRMTQCFPLFLRTRSGRC